MVFARAAIGTINRLVGAVGLVVGLAFLLTGGVWIARYRMFVANARVAEGQVIASQREVWHSTDAADTPGSSVEHTSYRAFVRFADQSGQVFTYRDTIAFNPPSFVVGQRVTIFYDPERPLRAMIDRGARIYLLPLGILVFGSLMTLGSVQRLFDRRILAAFDFAPEGSVSVPVLDRPAGPTAAPQFPG